MESRVETITPDLAKEYLKSNIENNRRINRNRVLVYAKDMASGAWQLNGEGIRFNENGELIDGQHRLRAIIMANRPVDILVTRDISNDITVFDRGYTRATYSSLRMGGYEKEIANSYTVALAKLCLLTRAGSKAKSYMLLSDNDVLEFLIKNQDDVMSVYELCVKNSGNNSKSKRISTRSASIMCAVFEAVQNGEDKNVIMTFLEVFKTGFYENKEQTAAIVLRNDFISNSIMTTGFHERERAVYCTEKAISDFCAGRSRKITYANWEEPVYTKYMEVAKNEKAGN